MIFFKTKICLTEDKRTYLPDFESEKQRTRSLSVLSNPHISSRDSQSLQLGVGHVNSRSSLRSSLRSSSFIPTGTEGLLITEQEGSGNELTSTAEGMAETKLVELLRQSMAVNSDLVF